MPKSVSEHMQNALRKLEAFWPGRKKAAHANIALWLFKDAFGRSPLRLVILVALGLSGAALQASVLMTLYWAASHLPDADQVAVPFTALQLNREEALIAVAVAIVMQATLATLASYLFGVNTIEQWRIYHLHIAESALSRLSRGVAEGRIEGRALYKDRTFINLFGRSGPRIGILFRRLLHAMSAAIRFCVFLALSLYVHAGLTMALIACAVVVGAIAVFKFARDSSHNSRLLRERVVEAKKAWRQLADMAGRGETISLDEVSGPDQPIGLYHRSFQARFLNLERGRLFALLTMIALIAATLAVFGNAVLENTAAWPDLTTALVAIVMTMIPLSQLTGVISVIGHFYPDVKLYRGTQEALVEAATPEEFERKFELLRATEPKATTDQSQNDEEDV